MESTGNKRFMFVTSDEGSGIQARKKRYDLGAKRHLQLLTTVMEVKKQQQVLPEEFAKAVEGEEEEDAVIGYEISIMKYYTANCGAIVSNIILGAGTCAD